ncbi:hypothetical protein GCM10009681_25780 [Luedemannella helvata]|uniref:Peptidase S8/S53 domain-containing protein n=1 Tax=Luedemannella helvata TaxID=349315 RepID=A0ABN2KDL1_9ACTN
MLAAVLPAVPAAAAPTCEPATSYRAVTDVPWPQRRYDYASIARLADGRGVTVAVIDSGVDADHPQLRGRVAAGVDLVDGGNGQVDCVGHGTAVASVIAARPRSGSGLRGLAAGATILPIRVTDRHDSDGDVVGSGLDAKGVATAVRRAILARVGVINLSLSTTTDDPALRDAIADAVAADIVVVAAAGNARERGNPTPYPAAYPGVLGVGAIDESGQRVAASQVGSYVDIVAPGAQVIGAQPGGGHAAMSGTSLAAPFVAATAALVRQYRSDLDAAAVARRLLATADPAPGARRAADYGHGVLNPLRALTDVLPVGAARAPAAGGVPTRPTTAAVGSTGLGRAFGVGGVLVAAGGSVALIAMFVPAGRRRRWRPGVLSARDPGSHRAPGAH